MMVDTSNLDYSQVTIIHGWMPPAHAWVPTPGQLLLMLALVAFTSACATTMLYGIYDLIKYRKVYASYRRKVEVKW